MRDPYERSKCNRAKKIYFSPTEPYRKSHFASSLEQLDQSEPKLENIYCFGLYIFSFQVFGFGRS